MDRTIAQVLIHDLPHFVLCHLFAHVHHRENKLLLADHAIFICIKYFQRLYNVLDIICVVSSLTDKVF